MIQTRQRIDYRSGKVAIIRRTSMSYDRLMQVVAEQAMQRAAGAFRFAAWSLEKYHR